MTSAQAAADVFARYRPLLFSIAYEMLGSAADAEDVLQESYLRWADADRAVVRDERSYLTRIVTRQALNHLRSVARRRETYVGPWLPEPVRTEADASEDVILAESLSFAMLLMLESLAPDERAVFVLREVFAFPHSEIADMVGKTELAVRQMTRRAKTRVQEGRKRFDADIGDAEAILGEFLASASTGDVDKLVSLLTEDTVMYTDAGGAVGAPRRPVRGSAKVARFIAGASKKGAAGATFEFTRCNAVPAAVMRVDGHVIGVVMADITDGKISSLYLVGNQEKLRFTDRPLTLTRNQPEQRQS